MLSFLVLVSREGALRAAELARISDEAALRLPYEPASLLHWTTHDGRVALLGWALHPDGFPPGSRWHADEHGVTAFGGYAFPTRGSWAPGSWARQLGSLCHRGEIGPNTDQCWGVFTMAHLSADGVGFVGRDPLSIGQLYRSSTTEFDVVANRPDLAAMAVGTYWKRDSHALGWLVVNNYILDDSTAFSGVRALRPSVAVSIHGELGLRELAVDDPWNTPPPAYEDALATMSRDITDHIATITSLERPIRVSLTGGRDSRLVFAFAVAAGVETSFHYVTTESFPGRPDPDVEVASMLAHEFGLQHRVQRINLQHVSSDAFEQRVRIHAHTTYGMLGAKNLRRGLLIRPYTQVSGAFGEVLTGQRTGDAPPASPEDAYLFLVSLMYGGHPGLLRPEAREHYLSLLREMVIELAADGCPADELASRFYVKRINHNWLYHELQIPGITPDVEPLYSVHIPALARAAGWHRRRYLRVLFDLMRTAAPRLVELPFANVGWPQELLATLPDGDRFRAEPVVASTGPRALRGLRWQDHREVFRKYLLDGGNNPVADMLDRQLLEDVLAEKQPLPPGSLIQLHNALGVAVWLAGAELPQRVTSADVQRIHARPVA